MFRTVYALLLLVDIRLFAASYRVRTESSDCDYVCDFSACANCTQGVSYVWFRRDTDGYTYTKITAFASRGGQCLTVAEIKSSCNAEWNFLINNADAEAAANCSKKISGDSDSCTVSDLNGEKRAHCLSGGSVPDCDDSELYYEDWD
eukprot:TRINITY_DN4226_c0_g2_i1.p1 TRINITY_DN4226_c0_g2~~TRINITY_DN4226_c0_g2_i1.p1  ORF type:complete len:147 (-),score=11.91 TRINITY_DN4226_c0_g2_i1:26-466(-)